MDDLLTDEEMAVVQGDKERCLAVIGAFGTCDGCSAYCRGISKAQSAKTKAAVVAEGWLDPKQIEEKLCAMSIIYGKASDKAFQGWKSPEEVSQFLDDHVRITNRAVDQARADERKAIGKWLDSKPVKRSSFAQCYRKVIDEEIDALLEGERP
jgi:hypothetical protein